MADQKTKVWVKTWGCSHNNSDGEYMAGLLQASGDYQVVLLDSDKHDADVWLLNSCTVKGPSEQTFINEIRAGIQSKTSTGQDRKVVLAGCVPQAQLHNKEWDGLSIIGVQQIDRVVQVVEETIKGNTVRFTRDKKIEIVSDSAISEDIEDMGQSIDVDLDQDALNIQNAGQRKKRKAGGATLDMPKIRRNPFIEIIPINTGCLNQCTYCKTKHARGDLGSYTPLEITARIAHVIKEGVVEIWLTSEDLGAYGHDIGVKVTELLWKCIETLEQEDKEGIAMIRVGMTNPPYILNQVEEMAKILQHPRVYSFLHIPVQAASDKVLNDMRRLYTQADFRKVVNVLQEQVPNMTIATDVICGFPTETAEDFEETLALLRHYEFPVLHISQFYPRPGTPAARLPLLNTMEVKRRSREATKIFESYSNYSIPTEPLSILVTEISADKQHYVGHDKAYRQILVPMNTDLMGKKVLVEIYEVGKFYLKGRLVPDAPILASPHQQEQVSSAPMKAKRMPKVVRVKRELVRVDSAKSLEPASLPSSEPTEPLFELSLGSQPEAYVARESHDASLDSPTQDTEDVVPTSSFFMPHQVMLVYTLILALPLFLYMLLFYSPPVWWSEMSLFYKAVILGGMGMACAEGLNSVYRRK